MHQYWLMKSEPDVHSYAMHAALPDGIGGWDGVRNYQARNYMRTMQVGDLVLFYHSNATPPHVAGVARIVREAYPDLTAHDPQSDYYDPKAPPDNPRWSMVDVQAVAALPTIVPLQTLRETPALAGMVVIQRGSRLSITPVTEAEFLAVVELGGLDPAGLVG